MAGMPAGGLGRPADNATVQGVLSTSMPSAASVRAALPSLPSARDALANGQDPAPNTWEEAFAYVQARLEAKRRKELKRQDSRIKTTGKPPVGAVPGARFGGEPEKTAFWTITEEYFRDIRQDDLMALLPAAQDPLKDSAFRVPPLTRLAKPSAASKKPVQASVRKLQASSSAQKTPATVMSVSKSVTVEKDACAICMDGESYDENKIIFCDSCDIGVHQHCYGVPVIPEGSWNCSACLHEAKTGIQPSCIICPVRGGALKPCAPAAPGEPPSEWMHVLCSQWMPETFVKPENQRMMEPIEGAGNILKGRRGLQCCICKEKSGACIQCSLPQCRTSFHPMCAQRAGLQMIIQDSNSDTLDVRAFCQKHATRDSNGDIPGGQPATPLPPAPAASMELTTPAPGPAPTPPAVFTPAAANPTPVPKERDPYFAADPVPLLAQCSPEELSNLALMLLALDDTPASASGEPLLLQHMAREAGRGMAGAELKKQLEGTARKELTLPADVADSLRTWLDRQSSSPEGVTSVSPQLPANGLSVAVRETPKEAGGTWGEVPISKPGGWSVRQALLQRQPLPNSHLSTLPPLQELASKLVDEDSQPAEEATHPYIVRMLEGSLPPGMVGDALGQGQGQIDAAKARAGTGAAADAVAACITAGAEAGTARESDLDLLAVAPDDEVLGEILALQSELAMQMCANRRGIDKLLEKVVTDLPAQQEAQKKRTAAEKDMDTWVERIRQKRRVEKQEKKAQAQREAAAMLEAAAAASPRLRSADPVDTAQKQIGPLDLLDPLAAMKSDGDAVCVVCGEGHSETPNVIVFCERCDIGVHQLCYGVASIPAGEWLCWPCLKHEDTLEAKGYSKAQIRPPRWQRKGKTGLEGGSTETQCAVCPNVGGAFRRTIDGKQWVHEVCAKWHPDLAVIETGLADVVVGVTEVRRERWNAVCGICKVQKGATAPCAATGCTSTFHPLCARRVGLPLVSEHQSLALKQIAAAEAAEQLRLAAGAAPNAAPPPPPVKQTLPTPVVKKQQEQKKPKVPKETTAKVSKPKVSKRLATLERELELLNRARVEMEQMRLLCSCVKRRERDKRQLSRILQELDLVRTTVGGKDGISQLEALLQMSTPFALTKPPSPPSTLAGHKRRDRSAEDRDPGTTTTAKRGRPRRPNPEQITVDAECMMTANEAEAVNDKLPQGYLYVPTDALAQVQQHIQQHQQGQHQQHRLGNLSFSAPRGTQQ